MPEPAPAMMHERGSVGESTAWSWDSGEAGHGPARRRRPRRPRRADGSTRSAVPAPVVPRSAVRLSVGCAGAEVVRRRSPVRRDLGLGGAHRARPPRLAANPPDFAAVFDVGSIRPGRSSASASTCPASGPPRHPPSPGAPRSTPASCSPSSRSRVRWPNGSWWSATPSAGGSAVHLGCAGARPDRADGAVPGCRFSTAGRRPAPSPAYRHGPAAARHGAGRRRSDGGHEEQVRVRRLPGGPGGDARRLRPAAGRAATTSHGRHRLPGGPGVGRGGHRGAARGGRAGPADLPVRPLVDAPGRRPPHPTEAPASSAPVVLGRGVRPGYAAAATP